ncbi:hypothetical protein Golomagni_05987 [Golovinomyces magnicellulatus]|nr:hypothetical protein Golomagni_05987 [Golovinomyces magnicellulatus]
MVLETDTPHPDTYSQKGSFGEILHDHFAKAGSAHKPPLAIETDQIFVVTEQGGRIPRKEEFDGFDGLLITGSLYDAHGDNPWILELLQLLKDLWLSRADFRFTGVCFGHQLLSRLLGAACGPAPTGDWELGHCRIEINEIGQRLFRTKEKFVHLHQMHQDQVAEVPSGKGFVDSGKVKCWGTSEHTPIQGLYVPNKLFTSQAHLAFDQDMVKRQIAMRVERGSIKDIEHADRAAETAHLQHDGEEVAKAILRLFVFDDDGMGYSDI